MKKHHFYPKKSQFFYHLNQKKSIFSCKLLGWFITWTFLYLFIQMARVFFIVEVMGFCICISNLRLVFILRIIGSHLNPFTFYLSTVLCINEYKLKIFRGAPMMKNNKQIMGTKSTNDCRKKAMFCPSEKKHSVLHGG
jgi:hypothetical protein